MRPPREVSSTPLRQASIAREEPCSIGARDRPEQRTSATWFRTGYVYLRNPHECHRLANWITK